MSAFDPALLVLPPLSLYVHIPWCIKKCPYCDFNSHTSDTDIDEDAYLYCLLKDFETEIEFIQGRHLSSIFFGGGTPSLMSADFYQKLFRQLQRHISFAADIEITLEANPGTFEQNKFQGYYDAGINRLSIGVQSFNAAHLKALGRIHDDTEAKRAIESAQRCGFDNFNIDLMHGLPHQDNDDAQLDLSTAISLGAPHISWYQLTIEANTEFYNKPPPLPEELALADIQDQGEHFLQQKGFEHYEISAFARAQHQSTHNLNYWTFGDYIGIGAGAHGKVSTLEGILRRSKTRLPQHYLKRSDDFVAKQQIICDEDINLEFMMNILRLTEGVNLDYYEARTGRQYQPALRDTIESLQQRGLMIHDSRRLQISALGRRFLNNVLESF